ncbi:MAG TPA: hypothetical protein ENN38_04065 [Actinobacteria bacterium]|nr:hypothetical protein [Actinomycetota bacterium]
MGNIGTEIGRVIRAKKQNDNVSFINAVDRTLELFDLTISDRNRRGQLKEIVRAREVFLDSLEESPEYRSNLVEIDKYFMHFAMAARLNL